MSGARGRETCAPSGEFGGGVVDDLDGDFAMLIDELSTKTLVLLLYIRGDNNNYPGIFRLNLRILSHEPMSIFYGISVAQLLFH